MDGWKEDVYARIGKPKRSFRLAVSDLPRYLGYILIERSTDIVVIAKDESLFEIEPDSDNIACIRAWKGFHLINFELVFE